MKTVAGSPGIVNPYLLERKRGRKGIGRGRDSRIGSDLGGVSQEGSDPRINNSLGSPFGNEEIVGLRKRDLRPTYRYKVK
jgi:hypothetical protein